MVYNVLSRCSYLCVVGNILVLIAFVTDSKLRTFGNWFILNLAITDIFVGILIPIYAPYAVSGEWPYGHSGCVAFMVVDYIVPMSSSWNIAFISLDRWEGWRGGEILRKMGEREKKIEEWVSERQRERVFQHLWKLITFCFVIYVWLWPCNVG